MNELITLSTEINTVTTENAKTGALTTRIQKPKEFKEAFKAANPEASNRAIKKAYESYVTKTTTELAKGFDFTKAISLAEQGKLGIESVRVNRDGDKTTVCFLDLSGDATITEVQELAEKLDAEALKSVLAYLSAKLEPKNA